LGGSSALALEMAASTSCAAVDQAKACLKKDRACLEFAKKKKARYEDLVKKEFISQLAFEEYERDVATCTAQVQKDIADLDAAKINLEYCTIKADQAGRISHFKADPGNLVTSNEPLNEIRQLNPINVRFQIAERDFQKIKHLNNLSVNILQESGDSHFGKIHFIDNHINDETGTILLKAQIENKDLALWPGEFVKVRLHLKTRENAILIPKSALQYDTKGSFVFVTSDDSVKKQHVTLAETVGDKIVVIEGLTNSDKIVTKGALNLTDGKKVTIKK
jgi:RND family efflux transporter MFP subunit